MIHDWKWTEGTFDFVLFFIGWRFPPQFAKKKSNEIIRCLLLQYSEYVFVHIFDDIFRKRSVRDLITGFKHDSTTCHRCTCYSCIVNERLTKRARVYRGHKLIVYGIDISILEYLAGIYRRQGCNRKFDFRDPTKIETESFAWAFYKMLWRIILARFVAANIWRNWPINPTWKTN